MISSKSIENTIGKTFADKLDEVIFDVSQELSFSKREMVMKLDCPNFLAARRLEKVLKRLKIFSAAKLYRTDPISLARCKGIGEASIFVAMCILDSRKFDVEKWWNWGGKNEYKFSSAKRKAIKKAGRGRHDV